MNSKNTKRALLSSVVAMLVCFTMLLSTTFAWFTDNASTKVNTINTGSFDINILDANGALIDDEMEENDYLIGLDLDIDKLIYGEILVNWPMKVLCNDDCRGICKVCGMNLNKGDCDCQRTELDPRMAAIQDVFNKFKEV